jgi:AcrR family transcriptional regulator
LTFRPFWSNAVNTAKTMNTSKTHSRRDKKREKIIAAARELFARYSFKKTSMEEIAKASGRAKSSIYYYFKGKKEIFRAVANQEMEKWMAEIKKATAGETSPDKKICAYIKMRSSAVYEISAFYLFIAEEYFENYTFIDKLRHEFDKEEAAIIAGVLKEGVRRKIFSLMDVNLAAENILSLLKGLEYIWLKEKNSAEMGKNIGTLTTIFLKGLLRR